MRAMRIDGDGQCCDPEAAGFDPAKLDRALAILRREAAGPMAPVPDAVGPAVGPVAPMPDATGHGGEAGSPPGWAYPGGVVLVAVGMKLAALESFGVMSLTDPPGRRVPMPVDAIFDVASITKAVATTTITLKLMEAGELTLDDPVARFLPAFGTTSKAAITIRHLLTHTSGLPPSVPLYGEEGSLAERLREFLSLEPLAPPGARVEYSCVGFILLGLVQSLILSGKVLGGGRDVAAFFAENVSRPLGMVDTCFYTVERPVDDPSLRRVVPTERRSAHERGALLWSFIAADPDLLARHDQQGCARGAVHDENALALGGVAGNAGLFSTALDLARFAWMYLDQGRLDGARVLNASSIALATANYTPGLGENRGLGWQLKSVRTARNPIMAFGDYMSDASFGHTGFTGTGVWVDPVRRLVVVLLTNRVHPTRSNERLMDIRPRFMNALVSALREDV